MIYYDHESYQSSSTPPRGTREWCPRDPPSGGEARVRPRPQCAATGIPLAERCQYESAETTSPPAIDPSAHHVGGLMVDVMNLTLPSHKRTFTPPGCLLLEVNAPLGWYPVSYSQLQELGGMIWV
jgi:hypothetical protein